MFKQLGLIGCGLMGGSFALALKRSGLVETVVGYSQTQETTQKALQLGVVDRVVNTPSEAVRGADLVLIAVPVAAIEPTLQAIGPHLSDHCLVMDVGSTKQDVVMGARRALNGQIGCFVPAHPIAGKEHAGVEHASADLYAGCQVVLTPTQDTPMANTERAQTLWEALGCRVRCMSPEAHDTAYAAVSHLPHLLAYALVDDIAHKPHANLLFQYAASGFRDFTRIAGSSPEMWRDISLANRDAILEELDSYSVKLQQLRASLKASDSVALEAIYSRAQTARMNWISAIETAESQNKDGGD